MRRGVGAVPSVMFGVLLLLSLTTLFFLERSPQEQNTAGMGFAGGGAVLSASPNPCRIVQGETSCATLISWSTDGLFPSPVVQVWRTGNEPAMIACTPRGQAGSLLRTVTAGEERTFALFAASECTDTTADRSRSISQITIFTDMPGEESRDERIENLVKKVR